MKKLYTMVLAAALIGIFTSCDAVSYTHLYKTQEVKASDNMEVTLQEDANDLQEVV